MTNKQPSGLAQGDRKIYLIAAFVIAVSAALAALTSYHHWHPGSEVAPTAAIPGPSITDAAYRKLVVGTWEDDYQGQRQFTVREDGTATMVITFEGMRARMFTPRLQLETTWTISGGHFMRKTVGGEPSDKVAVVIRHAGDRADDQILEITTDHMNLLDQDNQTHYQWRKAR